MSSPIHRPVEDVHCCRDGISSHALRAHSIGGLAGGVSGPRRVSRGEAPYRNRSISRFDTAISRA